MNEQLLSLSKKLKNRGFEAEVCENILQAAELVSKIISRSDPVNSIGFGNSMTIQSSGLQESLAKPGREIYIHKPQGTAEADRKALTADFYLTSANAISLDGHIVNIDGTGNRTAATCFGPKYIIYLVTRNKVAENLEKAMQRAKEAAVRNAKKYARKTPCVRSGTCEDCLSPECICSVTTIHRKKPYGMEMTVILIDEDAGL